MAGSGGREPLGGAEETESGRGESDVAENPIDFSEYTDSEFFSFIDRCAEDIASARDRPVLYLLYPSHGHIGALDALGVYHTFLYNSGIDDLDIVLHSPGGVKCEPSPEDLTSFPW